MQFCSFMRVPQTSLKVMFTLEHCCAFTSVLPPCLSPPPGFISFSPCPWPSSYCHTHLHPSPGLHPTCQIQIYILEARCCQRKTHNCVYWHLYRCLMSHLHLSPQYCHQSIFCSSQQKFQMIGTLFEPLFSNCKKF